MIGLPQPQHETAQPQLIFLSYRTVRHIPGTEAYFGSTEVKIQILLFWAGNGFICSE